MNKATSFTYNTSGQVATITDATGVNPITFGYHASSDSACSGIVPSPGAALPCTVVTDQNGHSTTYAYNSQLQVTYTKDARGFVSTKSFDALNYNVTQYSDALLDTSVFSFDNSNNLKTATDGAGAQTQFGYPAAGSNNQYYPLSQTDSQGNVSSFGYDSNGNMLSAMDQKTNTGLTLTYNGNGTVATQKDANGNTTTFGYDGKGNLSSVTQPSPLGKTTLSVDALSRASSLTDGNNHKTTYGYDNKDRVTLITYADSSQVSYSYDTNGNILSETDSTGKTTFQYDVLNRLTLKTLPGGTKVSSGYDAVGNLTSYNDGTGAVGYTYDQANRMTTLTEPDGSKSSYGYDNANRKISIHYPNNTGMLMTYDGAGHELTNSGGKLNASNQITSLYTYYQYSYQSSGKQTALLQSTTYRDPVTQNGLFYLNYSYDSLSRLTEGKIEDGNQNTLDDFKYGYDANGNMTSSSVLTWNTSYSNSYNAASELTSSSKNGGSPVTYSYDGVGNLTGVSGGASTTYNNKNQATSVGSNSYTYSGTTQSERVKVNGDSFVYGGLGLTSTTTSAGTTEFVRCSCGLLNNERTPDGQKYYYLFDGLGSVIGMTDSTGGLKNSYEYTPFGQMYNSHQSSVSNPWGYAGGYTDSATGLIKFGIRYYDAVTGRWTQRTPVGGSLQETLKANPYVYASDNPVNAVDPSGKVDVYVWWATTFFNGAPLVSFPFAVIINFTPSETKYIAKAGTGAIGGMIAYLIGATTSPQVGAILAGIAGGITSQLGTSIGSACGQLQITWFSGVTAAGCI